MREHEERGGKRKYRSNDVLHPCEYCGKSLNPRYVTSPYVRVLLNYIRHNYYDPRCCVHIS